jgi:hypothetical protein
MAQGARWIRLGLVEPTDLHASYAGLASAMPPDAAPIVLWAQAGKQLCLCRGTEGGDRLAWAEERQHVFVVIAPARLAPGRASRWTAWALSPAVAAYRDFGQHAYLNGSEIWLQGRKIACSSAAPIGECAVVASSFPFRDCVEATPGRGFRHWLRAGLALAPTEWAEHGATPPERVLEGTLRARIEAQHGWQFENSWPTAAERAAIDEARRERVETVESG